MTFDNPLKILIYFSRCPGNFCLLRKNAITFLSTDLNAEEKGCLWSTEMANNG